MFKDKCKKLKNLIDCNFNVEGLNFSEKKNLIYFSKIVQGLLAKKKKKEKKYSPNLSILYQEDRINFIVIKQRTKIEIINVQCGDYLHFENLTEFKLKKNKNKNKEIS